MNKTLHVFVVCAAALFAAVEAYATTTLDTLEVGSGGYTLADDTIVGTLKFTTGPATLDLAGYNLTVTSSFVAYRDGSSYTSTYVQHITNSNTSKSPVLTINSAFDWQFRMVKVEDNIAVKLSGTVTGNNGWQGLEQANTGGWELVGLTNEDSSKWLRFSKAGSFGVNGGLVLKNGTALRSVTTTEQSTWGDTTVEGSATVEFDKAFNFGSLTDYLNVDAGSSVKFRSISGSNAYINHDLTRMYGVMHVETFWPESGTKRVVTLMNPSGVPNGTVDLVAGELRYGGVLPTNGVFPVGSLRTAEGVSGTNGYVDVRNTAGNGNVTLQVGALGKNDTFNGGINFDGNNKDWALEKVGSGTFTLGGTNTFRGVTTLTGGTLALSGLAILGNESTAADIVFNGGTLEFAADLQKLPAASRLKATSAPAKISVATGGDFSYSTLAGVTAGLVKSGAGNLTLSEIDYAGDTTIAAGTLTVPVGSTFSKLTVTGGSLVLAADREAWAAAENGTQILTITELGEGTDLSAAITFTGLGVRDAVVLSRDAGTGVVTVRLTAKSIVWNGADGADWSDANAWTLDGNATTFFAGDSVLFTGAAFGGSATSLGVAVAGDVAPQTMAVDAGAGKTYTFSGGGTVTPEDGLVTLSSGSLTLASGVFSGATVTNAGGTVVASGAAALAGLVCDDTNTYAVVEEGASLVLGTVGETAHSVSNRGELVFSGNAVNASYIAGAGAVVVTNGATLQYNYYSTGGVQYPHFFGAFTGDTYIYPAATLELYQRNSAYSGCFFGTGGLKMRGGTVHFLRTSANTIGLNGIDLAADTESTFLLNQSSADVQVNGGLTGTGALNLNVGTEYRYGIRFLADNSSFAGTVNFNGDSECKSVHGLLRSQSGSANAVWNVTGAPATLTTLVNFEMQTDGQTLRLGALNVTNENALVYCKKPITMEIGGRANVASYLNNTFAMANGSETKSYGIKKVGSGTLTLGPAFRFEDYLVITNSGLSSVETFMKEINVAAGTLINNADLTGYKVTIGSGATIGGAGTYPAGMALSGAYTIKTAVAVPVTLPFAVNFATASIDLDLGDFDGSDRTAAPVVMTATSFSGRPNASQLASLNGDVSEGRWAFGLADNGNGTVSLVVRWRAKRGTVFSFR